jgi:hypothetical protein
MRKVAGHRRNDVRGTWHFFAQSVQALCVRANRRGQESGGSLMMRAFAACHDFAQ